MARTHQHDDWGATWTEIARALGPRYSRQNAEYIYNGALRKLRGALRAGWPLVTDLREFTEHWEGRYAEGKQQEGLNGPESDRRHTRELRAAMHPRMYPDWATENTRVVFGPFGRASSPGKWFPDRKSAREYWLARAGRIHEEHRLPGKYFFRVPKETR